MLPESRQVIGRMSRPSYWAYYRSRNELFLPHPHHLASPCAYPKKRVVTPPSASHGEGHGLRRHGNGEGDAAIAVDDLAAGPGGYPLEGAILRRLDAHDNY